MTAAGVPATDDSGREDERERLGRWLFERDYHERGLCSPWDADWDEWVERNREEWREEADALLEFLGVQRLLAVDQRELPRAPDGGTYALHCRAATCSTPYRWTLTREGDVVTTWACDRHLAPALHELQRDPHTRVIVTIRALGGGDDA